jgi:hypothetical protein
MNWVLKHNAVISDFFYFVLLFILLLIWYQAQKPPHCTDASKSLLIYVNLFEIGSFSKHPNFKKIATTFLNDAMPKS